MRIKFLFCIWVVLLLSLAGCLLWMLDVLVFPYKWLLLGFIAVILLYLSVFYQKILKPLHTLDSGMDLLREQDFSSRISSVGQYDADRIVGVFNRMMDQLKNERLRLREQNHFLDLLIQASPMGVVITTLDGDISQLNPMAEKMLGTTLPQVLGKSLKDIDIPLAKELSTIPKESTKVVRLNDANIYKCSRSHFVDRGFSHPFYLLERMTDEVVRAEKKAYEKVIRMIAHEVNNTTAGITSTLDTVEQTIAAEAGMEDLCEVVHVCMDRCYSMSRFITRFADVVKIPEPTKTEVKLNDLVQTCARFMEGMCNDRSVVLRVHCDDEVGKVKLDGSLMEQVLVNIIKNAVESIECQSEYKEQPGEVWIVTQSPATVEIIDNGKGISEEVESKLFTPFFSTKPNGQGIGLVFIREVLLRHQCSFSLRTGSDGLTRFRIQFLNT